MVSLGYVITTSVLHYERSHFYEVLADCTCQRRKQITWFCLESLFNSTKEVFVLSVYKISEILGRVSKHFKSCYALTYLLTYLFKNSMGFQLNNRMIYFGLDLLCWLIQLELHKEGLKRAAK